MTTPYRRHGQLTWPPTQEQWQSLDLELANIYRQIRNGVGGGTVDLSNLDADNLTSGTVPDAVLANTGVSAGTFGDASHVSQVTVDIKGRVTFAGNVAITGAGTVVVASVYRSTNQTLTSGTEAAITLDTVAFDSSTMWASGAATRLTVPTAQSGTYWINGQIQLDTGFAGTAHVRLYKNGTLAAETTSVGARLSSGAENHSCGALLSLIATDFVEMKVLLELATGTTFAVVGGATATFLQAMKASPQASAGGGDIRSDGTVAFAANQSMGSHKITNVTDPSSAQDAATKAYVDAHAAGDLVKIAQVITAASQATVDFASIPATYSTLKVLYTSQDTQTGTGLAQISLKLNADTTAADYTATSRAGAINGATLVSTVAASTSGGNVGAHPQTGNTNIAASGEVTITGYASTVFHKRVFGLNNLDDGTNNGTVQTFGFRWKSTAAINELTFTATTAFTNGSTFTLYGMK